MINIIFCIALFSMSVAFHIIYVRVSGKKEVNILKTAAIFFPGFLANAYFNVYVFPGLLLFGSLLYFLLFFSIK